MDSSPSRGSSLLHRGRTTTVLGALALIGLVLGVWAWPAANDMPLAATATADTLPVAGPPAESEVIPPPAVVTRPAATVASESPAPDGLTPQEWTQLRQALADTPHAASELQRIARWLGFQRRGQRFQDALHRHDHSPETLTLARQIDGEIDTHLNQGELSGPEALALKSAVLTELEPDVQAREQALARWRQGQIDRASAAADPRDAAYLAAQADVLTQWRTPSNHAPDNAALQSQLTRLREHVYAVSSPAP